MTSEIPGVSGAADYTAGTAFGKAEAAAQRARYGVESSDWRENHQPTPANAIAALNRAGSAFHALTVARRKATRD